MAKIVKLLGRLLPDPKLFFVPYISYVSSWTEYKREGVPVVGNTTCKA